MQPLSSPAVAAGCQPRPVAAIQGVAQQRPALALRRGHQLLPRSLSSSSQATPRPRVRVNVLADAPQAPQQAPQQPPLPSGACALA